MPLNDAHAPTSSQISGEPQLQVQALATRLHELMQGLEAAASQGVPPIGSTAVLEVTAQLLPMEEGLSVLYAQAHRFGPAGIFAGGPWAQPAQLQPPLVGGTLRAPGLTPVVETLSELRMLAIAKGRCSSDEVSAQEATDFLNEIMARNLRYLFPAGGTTEEERGQSDPYRASHERLFALIAQEVGVEGVLKEVLSEAEQILAQRPVSTWGVRRMILRAHSLAQEEGLEGAAADTLRHYAEAARGPSPLSKQHPGVRAYRQAVAQADRQTLQTEAELCGASMVETGLVAPAHGVLVRQLLHEHQDLLATALTLDKTGSLELEHNQALIHEVINAAVFATTAQCLYGLRLALQRTLFSRPEVTAGLERLIALDIQEDVQANLLAHRAEDDDVTPDAVLLAGTIAVLGQPLGIGQGHNPTCQSARGMSLWAQHDPARLLELIVAAARDGEVELMFHGQMLHSNKLPQGVAAEIDLDLDPASIVLVPHLDRLYSELMRRSVLQMEDAHKWVNRALYGRWVPHELASAFADLAQTTVANYPAYVRCFFATHHPEYNGGHRLMYPNPVGLVITDQRANYLGPHAVSIQRVEQDPQEQWRVYFFNPNNEGRQDWGQGVMPTVRDHGEEPGESSLPFEHFASRVYAFHYNPNEEGDRAAVPSDCVERVVEASRGSWGRRFHWLGL